MILQRQKSTWDKTTREQINHNWSVLESSFNNVVDVVSDAAFDKVVDAAALIWKEPVDTFADIPVVYPNPEIGWTVMSRELIAGVSKVYRYNGSEWMEIQQILADAINEVSYRLTNQMDRNNIDVLTLGVEEGTDETAKLDDIMSESEKRNLFFPYSETGFFVNEVIVPMQKRLDGRLTKVRVLEPDKRAFLFSNATEFIYDASVSEFEFKQPLSSDSGGGTANNHATLSFLGTVNAKALHNYFNEVSLGITFQFGNSRLTDRQGKFNYAIFNFFDGVEKMAIENIGTSYNRVVGNAVNGNGGNSHGIRFTGYGFDGINTPSIGHVATSNIILGMDNAFSFQNTAKYIATAGNTAFNLSGAVIDVKPPTNYDNAVSFNSVKAQTFKNVKRAIYNDEGQYNSYELVGSGTSDTAIYDEGSAQYGVDGHNHYRVLIKDIQNNGAFIRHPYAHLDLDLIDVTNVGAVIASGANHATGSIRVHKANKGVEIFASNCMLYLHVTECIETGGSSIVISGSNNVITLYTDKNVTLSGTNNTLIGYVGGSINVIGGSGTHDITKVKGYSGRKQEINKTTDANGQVTIKHGLKTGTLVPSVDIFGTALVHAKVRNLNTTDLLVEFRNYDGTIYANQSVSFMWTLEAV